jgi:hypothetical protein
MRATVLGPKTTDDKDPHDLSDVVVPDPRCWDRDTQETPDVWIAGFANPITIKSTDAES